MKSEATVQIVRQEGDSLIIDITLPEEFELESVGEAFNNGPLANGLVQHTKSICRKADGTIQLRCFPNYREDATNVERSRAQLDRTVAYELSFQLKYYPVLAR